MLKIILNKKIEQFKITFPDFQTSKKTSSLYSRVGTFKEKKSVVRLGYSITKGTISKLGTKSEWERTKANFVYLISPKGKLMYSSHGGPFKSVTLKAIRNTSTILKDIFFIGKKYEWMIDYPLLWNYNFFQGFSSMLEAKRFLGFLFLSDDEFYKLFGDDNNGFDYLSPLIIGKDKEAVVALYKSMDFEGEKLLSEYIMKSFENDLTVEIPDTFGKVEILHDKVIWSTGQKDACNYSKEYRYVIEESFTKGWKEDGLSFKRLETPFEVYCQGLRQQNNLKHNAPQSLNKQACYTFLFDGKEYDLVVDTTCNIVQFLGRKNTVVPYDLRIIILRHKNPFKLVDAKPEITRYPYIKEGFNEFTMW